MNRRHFLAAGIVSAGVPLFGASPWGSPVLDIHLHPRSTAPEIDHLRGCGVDRAVLLPSANTEERATSLSKSDAQHFVRFTRADVMAPDAVRKLRAGLEGGAIGVGEMKHPVQADGPEMRGVYELCAEFRVPVLLHFEEGHFNSGFRRLPALLKMYPKTVFVGHGPTWWAHISAEPGKEAGYPEGPVKRGGLTDRMLADYENVYGDLSANSGRNGMARDPEFAAGFLTRHRTKLMFGSDCPCLDGKGAGQKWCIARETLTILKRSTTPELFRQIAWENGTRLLNLKSA